MFGVGQLVFLKLILQIRIQLTEHIVTKFLLLGATFITLLEKKIINVMHRLSVSNTTLPTQRRLSDTTRSIYRFLLLFRFYC